MKSGKELYGTFHLSKRKIITTNYEKEGGIISTLIYFYGTFNRSKRKYIKYKYEKNIKIIST